MKSLLTKKNEFLFNSYENVLLDFLKENEESLKINQNNISKIFKNDIVKKYPAFKDVYLKKEKNIEAIFSTIQGALNSDIKLLNKIGITILDKIDDVSIGDGDFHNGSCTSIVTMKDGQKLIYKPTDGSISHSYFNFLHWVNSYVSLGDYSYGIQNKQSYHWQEFVNQCDCKTSNDLKTYYKRSGYLLGVLYLLNSLDYHSENLIAKGDSPVVIDHETLIRPQINKKFKKYLNSVNEEMEDTVYDSFLLPYVDLKQSFPVGRCGLGFSKKTYDYIFIKQAVHRFTNDWKMVTKMITDSYIKNNVPIINGKKIFANDYIDELISGFTEIYELFLQKKEYLLSMKSPIYDFKNIPVRYIWRNTNVYYKILEFLKLPKNLKCKKSYEQKIRHYLSLAYKSVPENSELWLIFEHEVKQMMKGDIPYFEIDSSSKDLNTENGVIKGFFELSCVENIKRKLNKLSLDDLKYQRQLIRKSILE